MVEPEDQDWTQILRKLATAFDFDPDCLAAFSRQSNTLPHGLALDAPALPLEVNVQM